MNLSKKIYISIMLGLFVGLFVVLFFSGSFLSAQINFFVESYFDKFEYYANQNNVQKLGSGLGFLLNIVFFLTFLFGDRHERLERSWFVKMLVISYIFIPLSFVIPLIVRVGYYFQIIGIVGLIPILLVCRKNAITYAIFGLYMFVVLYSYVVFFYNDVWIDKYMEYNTIFSIL